MKNLNFLFCSHIYSQYLNHSFQQKCTMRGHRVQVKKDMNVYYPLSWKKYLYFPQGPHQSTMNESRW